MSSLEDEMADPVVQGKLADLGLAIKEKNW
jgi:hypothetical protein